MLGSSRRLVIGSNQVIQCAGARHRWPRSGSIASWPAACRRDRPLPQRRLGRPALSPARRAVAAMASALDALLRDNPGVRPEKLVSAHVEGDNGEGVRGSRAFLDLARDPRDRRAGERRARRRRHPLGLPRVLQAGGRGLRDAVAPGRALLADPPARQLHGVGGARGVDRRERLPARHPALARRPGSCTSTCTKTAAT